MSRLEVIAVCLVFLVLLLKQKKVVDMWQCSDVILPGEGQTGAGSAVEPQHVMLLCGNTSVKCSLLHSYVSLLVAMPITFIYPKYTIKH